MARLVGETSSDSMLPVTDSSGVVMDVVLCSHYGDKVVRHTHTHKQTDRHTHTSKNNKELL